jgi:DNA-binding NtrC family response regulator
MKTFTVYLRDGRVATVHADAFRHEENQYVFSKGGTSEVQFFVDSEVVGIFESALPQKSEAAPLDQGNLPSLAKSEEKAIVQALAECGGNRTLAARKLGISRRGLAYKLKRLEKDNLVS